MHHILGGVLIGAVLGGGTSKQRLRPFLRRAVKGGILTARKARAVGESLRTQAADLIAEARAEIDSSEKSTAE